jgi:hypothetical protein
MEVKNVCSQPLFLTCKKVSWLLSLSIVIYSCDNPAKFHFLKYDSASVVQWVDSTTTPNFGKLILQSYAPKVGESQKNLEAIAYAIDTTGNYFPSSPDTLTKVSDSLKKFKGTAVFGNNVLTKQKLLTTITDSTGQRISFDYIYFEPFINTTNRHLYYKIFATKNGQRILHKFAEEDEESDPCPPAQCFFQVYK